MSRKVLISLLQAGEVALVGLFFVQALRRLPGLLLNRGAVAVRMDSLNPENLATSPGMVDPALFTGELLFLLLMLALPLLAQVFQHERRALSLGVIFVAVARALPALGIGTAGSHVVAAVLGGGLACMVLLMRRRVMHFPALLIFGFAGDQLLRAAGFTMDLSWSSTWALPQLLLSAGAIVLTTWLLRRVQEPVLAEVTAQHGLLTLWGALGLGALLYLELVLLALPNAIAARSETSLTLIASLLVLATLLPLLPPARRLAHLLLQTFYGGLRGWLWLALVSLLLLIGLRLQGVAAALALILLQFVVSLMWWWLLRPAEQGDRNNNAFVLIAALLVTGLLLLGNFFTLAIPPEMNPFPAPADSGQLLQRMLRGLRGMDAALLLLAIVLAALPMTRMRSRIAWTSPAVEPFLPAALLVFLAAVLTAGLSAPRAADASLDSSTLRVASWNINAGATPYLHQDLESLAQTIQRSGADVVLLQNVDFGRSTSYWVDQANWLARRLDMQHRYFPAAGGTNGLAILARAGLQEHDAWLATGDGQQGGLQRVILDVRGDILTLYNYWPGPASHDLQLQIGTMNTLIGALHHRDEPRRLMLGASFSHPPDDQLLLPLRVANFMDPLQGHPLDRAWTTHVDGEEARTDYLWLRAPLHSTGSAALSTDTGGHRLILLEIELNPATS